jgi:hypothetical protein
MDINRNKMPPEAHKSDDVMNPADYSRWFSSKKMIFYEFVMNHVILMDRICKFPKAIYQIPLGDEKHIDKFIFEVPLNEELSKKHGVKTVFVQGFGMKAYKWVIGCTINDTAVFEYINSL